jgi:hypothetical protein
MYQGSIHSSSVVGLQWISKVPEIVLELLLSMLSIVCNRFGMFVSPHIVLVFG